MAKVMIVDDSRILRKILTSTLTDAGHEVIADAGNGKEALLLLERFEPDIITLDITMPVMDGLEALVKIKETYPNITVVMVSAAGQKSKVMEALKSGASDFLQKPFEPEDVIKVINRFV
ncbi:MAG: response regulator [Lachnospiraceae bacterium]|nr:response regulator [Lachnospiraceae bacterium]